MHEISNIFTKEKTISSLEVAGMMEIPHYEILKKLEGTNNPDGSIKQVGIIPTLTRGEIPVSDYFTLSSYKDSSGKENKCYEVTKKGCEFIANKLTGVKGAAFTARYINKFHDMEEHILGKKVYGNSDFILCLQGVKFIADDIICSFHDIYIVESNRERPSNGFFGRKWNRNLYALRK